MDHARHKLKDALYEIYPTMQAASKGMSIPTWRLACFLSGTLKPRRDERDRMQTQLKKTAVELELEQIDPALRKILYKKYGGVYPASRIMGIHHTRLAGMANGKIRPTDEEIFIMEMFLEVPVREFGF